MPYVLLYSIDKHELGRHWLRNKYYFCVKMILQLVADPDLSSKSFD